MNEKKEPKEKQNSSEKKEGYNYEPWYRYGVIILYLEMFLAIAFSIFALVLTFSGEGGISRH